MRGSSGLPGRCLAEAPVVWKGRAARLLMVLVLAFVPLATSVGVAQAATRLVDVNISLHGKPVGPDRTPYESIIKKFADGVYESSNGGIKLRTVRVYPDKAAAGFADIKWGATGWPSAAISGFGHPGSPVNMCDVFGSMDFLTEDAANGGYTLAHEWGHNFFGLYDEYAYNFGRDADPGFPHGTDLPVPNSIMNSQWNAVGGDFAWLNFSTALNETTRCAQFRMYGASGWETLVRPPADDPKMGAAAPQFARVSYPELASVAPSGAVAPRIDLPGTAQSDLKIEWMDEASVFQIVIDASGSMSGSPLDQAKSAAKLLVDVATTSSTVGVVAFDHTVAVVKPLTLIDSQAKRDQIKAAIDGISMGGSTAVGDAAQTALNGLVAYGGNSKKTVYLLSDGQSNSGVDPLSVIPAYVAAKIPMITFAYGTGADQTTLRALASGTGGAFFYAPATLADITGAFQGASGLAGTSVGVSQGMASLAPGKSMDRAFDMDPSLDRLYLSVSQSGSLGDATVVLIDPSGGVRQTTKSEAVGSAVQHTFSITNPASGRWILRVTSKSTFSTLDITYNATGIPGAGATFRLTPDVGQGTVQYPSPITIRATLAQDVPVSGARVTATIQDPNGVVSSLTLRDDGQSGDSLAQDGVYSAFCSYTMDGVYTIKAAADNVNGTAKLTYRGLALAIPPGGAVMAPPADKAVSQKFSRSAQTQVTVQGFKADDHGNTIAAATAVSANNTDTPGRIDYAGDVDVFAIAVPSGLSEMVFRVTDLALGMDPKLTILDPAGTPIGQPVTLANGNSRAGYAYVRVPTAGNTSLYAKVEHVSAAKTGTYRFSAGPAIATDNPLNFLSVAGPGRVDTAVEASKRGFPGKSDTIVLATGWNWPDALGGGSLAGAYGGPLLLTKPDVLSPQVLTEAARLDAKNVVILGSNLAVSGAVETALKGASVNGHALVVTRIGGAGRYDTAARIASAMVAVLQSQGGTYSGNAFFATGRNFPDALAASPVAAKKLWPILLVNATTPSSYTEAAITQLGVKKGYMLGSDKAVTAVVENRLMTLLPSAPSRLAGATRYTTGIAIARFGVANGLKWDGVAIATGANFPDALAGGVMQAKLGSVVLLTPGTALNASVAAELQAHRTEIVNVRYLGSTRAVSQITRNAVAAALR
jgi:calcium-activated chloride channel regulator 4